MNRQLNTQFLVVLASLMALATGCGAPPATLSAIEQCDQLAGDPHDFALNGAGVKLRDLRGQWQVAVERCTLARDNAANLATAARANYQLGRSLEAGGDSTRAAAAYSAAAEFGYKPAQVSWVLLHIGPEPTADDAYFYASYISEAANTGYKPAIGLIELAQSSALATNSSAFSGFARPDILMAAYHHDTQSLASIRSDSLFADAVVSASIKYYLRGFAESFASIWLCGAHTRAGLASAAKRHEIEQLTERALHEPTEMISEGITVIKSLVSPESIENRTAKGAISDVVNRLARNREARDRLTAQGQKDGSRLANLGCDNDITIRVLAGFEAFVNTPPTDKE